jgi:hypothetical protein
VHAVPTTNRKLLTTYLTVVFISLLVSLNLRESLREDERSGRTLEMSGSNPNRTRDSFSTRKPINLPFRGTARLSSRPPYASKHMSEETKVCDMLYPVPSYRGPDSALTLALGIGSVT